MPVVVLVLHGLDLGLCLCHGPCLGLGPGVGFRLGIGLGLGLGPGVGLRPSLGLGFGSGHGNGLGLGIGFGPVLVLILNLDLEWYFSGTCLGVVFQLLLKDNTMMLFAFQIEVFDPRKHVTLVFKYKRWINPGDHLTLTPEKSR